MRIQLSDHFTYGKLIRFTVPSIAMMIFTSVYGVVDGFFVSNYAGKTPFSAVNLIMPFLMITATIGFMFGTGGTAIVAKTLGEGNDKKANKYFSLFVYVTFALGVIFEVSGIVFIRPISALLGAKGELLENCVVYARIILAALPFYVLQLLFQSFFVAAYGVMMYISMIFSAAFIGYSVGTAPVISYHNGAQNYSESKGLLRQSLTMIGVFGLGMVAAAELSAQPLAKIFVGYDADLLTLTVSGFKVFALSFAFMGFSIFSSGFFTALNDGLTSALISFLRTLVFQIAAVMLLPLIWEIDGVWISIVVAEAMAFTLSAVFLVMKRNKYHY